MLKRIRSKTIKPSDRWVANVVLGLIIAYLGYSAYQYWLRGWYADWSWALLVMLIPVFLIDGLKILVESLHTTKILNESEDLSKVTVIVPSYNGEKVITATLKSLLKRFKPKNIIVSSNGSKDKTCEIAKSLGVRLLEIPRPIGKVLAINEALSMVKTPYVLIMDDDTLIGDAVIPTSELDAGRDGVAFRVLPVKEGWISYMQLHEYRKSMDVGRRFHNRTASVQNISGAIGLFKTVELVRQTKIHNGEFSGEDLQRTLLVHLARENKGGGVVMSESIVETLVPDSFTALFNQRIFGWYPGFLANFTLYMRIMFGKKVPFRLRFEAFFNCILLAALDPLRLLSLPVLLFTPVYLVFFYVTYVLLETIPYIRMGRHEPYWVILVFPIYGILNFITRIVAMSVFFYRRVSKYLGGKPVPDGHKFIGHGAALAGIVISLSITMSVFSTYEVARVAAKDADYEGYAMVIGDQVMNITTQMINQPEIQPLPEAEASSITPSVNVSKTYTAVPGDSFWSISYKAVDEYLSLNNLPKTDIENYTNRLTQKIQKPYLEIGESVNISTSDIKSVIY